MVSSCEGIRPDMLPEDVRLTGKVSVELNNGASWLLKHTLEDKWTSLHHSGVVL